MKEKVGWMNERRLLPQRFSKVSCAAVVALLVLLLPSFVGALPLAGAQGSSSTPASCPSNSVFTMMATEGTPNSFNLLDAASEGSFAVAYLAYGSGVSPFMSTAGIPDPSSTIVGSTSHNANYTSWFFTVKPGLKWSDGTNVTAQDIVATYSSNFALNPQYDLAGIHGEVTTVTAVNSSTAEFVLNQSDAHLPEKINGMVDTAVYPSSLTKNGPAYPFFGSPPGVGPFYVSNYNESSTQLTMFRNPYFSPKPGICEVVVYFIESLASTPQYIIGGTADFAPIASSAASTLASIPNIHIINNPATTMQYLGFNITEYPYNMTQFRQALVYGINDSNVINQALGGYGLPGYNDEGGVPSISSYYNSSIKSYSYDPNESLTLLKSIGFTQDSSGTLHYPNGTAVTLTFWADSDQPEDTLAASSIQSDLATIGINVKINVAFKSTIVAYSKANTEGVNGAIDLYDTGGPVLGSPYFDSQPAPLVYNAGMAVPVYPPTNSSSWEWPPSVESNYEHYLAQVDSTSNGTQEISALKAIQGINAQNLPVIILDYPSAVYAYNTRHFTNWPVSLSDSGQEWNLSAWAQIQPIGASSTTSTSSSTTTPITATRTQPTVTSGSSSITTTLITATSSSPTTGTGSSSNLLSTYALVGIVVVVIVIIVGAWLALRRRRPPTTPRP